MATPNNGDDLSIGLMNKTGWWTEFLHPAYCVILKLKNLYLIFYGLFDIYYQLNQL